MSAGRPLPGALRLLARGAALLYLCWGLVALAPHAGAPPEEAPLEKLRELASLPPEPEPEEAPEAEPAEPAATAKAPTPEESDAAEPPAAAPLVAGEADVARGDALLSGERPFPALSASYAEYGSFERYAGTMARLGARFVVVRSREVVGTADLGTGRFGAPEALVGFSPRARNYTDEPALRRLAQEAKQRFGAGASLRMIVPRQLDAALFGALARAIEAQGNSLDGLREIRGRFRPTASGGIALATESLVTRSGEVVPLSVTIDLGPLLVGAAGGQAGPVVSSWPGGRLG